MIISMMLRWVGPAAALVVAAFTAPDISGAASDMYLPRAVYPGTYGNYCGPGNPADTTGPACVPHGRFSDAPIDSVDAACMVHDVEYCRCQSALADRTGFQPAGSSQGNRNSARRTTTIPGISALTATRFVSSPVLFAAGVDNEYLACVDVADSRLVGTGIKLRSQAQRTACKEGEGDNDGYRRTLTAPSTMSTTTATPLAASNPTSSAAAAAAEATAATAEKEKVPSWLCGGKSDPDFVLARFEKMNLALFLRSLDWDAEHNNNNNNPQVTNSQTAGVNPGSSSSDQAIDRDTTSLPNHPRPSVGLTELEKSRAEAIHLFQRAGEAPGVAGAEPALRDIEANMAKILESR